jgi:TetR/AcrR family transcriptional regulator, cholesterol catabolism regulator
MATSPEELRAFSQRIDTTAEGELRRQQVLDSAAQLFASQGFESTTMQDIARESRLKKASLYHYFPSKHSILLEVLTDGMGRLLEEGRKAAQIPDPIERLDALLAAHLSNFGQKLPHVVVFLLERHVLSVAGTPSPKVVDYLTLRRAYDRLFSDAIRDGQEAGVLRPDNPVLLSYAVLGMVNWMVQWYREDGPMSLQEISAIFRQCALAAVRNPDH